MTGRRITHMTTVAAVAMLMAVGGTAHGATVTYNSIADINNEPNQPIIIGNDTLIVKDDSGGTVTASIESAGRSINPILEVDRNTAGTAVDFTFSDYQLKLAQSSSFTARKGDNVTSGTPTVTLSLAPTSSESNNDREYLYTTDGVDLRLKGFAAGSARRRIFVLSGNTLGNEVYGKINEQGSSAGSVTKRGNGTWTLSYGGSHSYTGPTRVEAGTLVCVTGGSCASSDATVYENAALGVSVDNNTQQFTWKSLTVDTATGTELKFAFEVDPSTTLAPMRILNDLTLTGTPTVHVDPTHVDEGRYPLIEVVGTAPSVIPELTGVKGELQWGGADNKTLFVTPPAATIFILR